MTIQDTYRATLWRDMTREEKGALLLAEYEGQILELWNPHDHEEPVWLEKGPTWSFGDGFAYRVKPVRETVTLYYGSAGFHDYCAVTSTSKITFDTIDGKPDLDSIKMEEL